MKRSTCARFILTLLLTIFAFSQQIIAGGNVSSHALARDKNQGVVVPPLPTTKKTPPKVKRPAKFSPSQKRAIEKIVHNYLISNPRVLAEASMALQKMQQQQASSAEREAILANKEKIFADPLSPVVGNPNGSVIVVEFFDYQCAHCKEMRPIIDKLLETNKNIKFIFKELPIFGKKSVFAAKVALGSAQQGKYWPVHEALLSAANPMTADAAMQAARKSGVDMALLRRAMKSSSIALQLASNAKLADRLSIEGTPTLIVANSALTNFNLIPGALDIDDLRREIKKVEG